VPPRPADGNRIAAQLGIISRQRRVANSCSRASVTCAHLLRDLSLLAGKETSSAAQNISFKCWTRSGKAHRILLFRGNMRCERN
jgi:hypothetical protein